MAKPTVFVLIILMFFMAVSVVCGEVIYVDANSPNFPGTGTKSDPFRRIQDAIDDKDTGSWDIVEIQPGIYTGRGNYNIDPNGFAIMIRSIDPNDSDIVASTIIDPNGAGRGFDLYRGENRNCIIAGLTISNGNAFFDIGGDGGAIRCTQGSSPTIRNCVIENCEAMVSGGGISCAGGSPYIIGCLIKDNFAEWYGGGISFVECNEGDIPIITRCRITGNYAGWEGGAIDLGLSNLALDKCVISDNEAATNGGGINCFDSSELSMINCTVAANTAADSGGALYCWYGSTAQVKNDILWANEASQGSQISVPFLYGRDSSVSVYYSDVQQGQNGVFVDPCSILNWGQSNISEDPNFALFGPGPEAQLWDFHLSSRSGRWDVIIGDWVQDQFTSRCIDAGDPNSAYAGEPWPHGRRINIGAYGGTGQASMNGNRADFNIDGTVNLVDFAEFARQWLNNEPCVEDMTGDGKVNSSDLVIFGYNWLWQEP